MHVPDLLRPNARGMYYGWVLVAGGFLIQLLNGSLLFHAFGAYVLPLQAEYGWSRAAISGAFSMARAESGILGPLQGWMIDRYGPRRIMWIGNSLFGLGFLLFSRMHSLATFYLAFACIAVGSSLGGFMPIITTVTNWFVRRRATALAIAMVGMGAGGLLVPAVMRCLAAYGWRTTALGSGLLILAVGVPVSLVMRRRPEDYGLLPDGDPPGGVPMAGVAAPPAPVDADVGPLPAQGAPTPAGSRGVVPRKGLTGEPRFTASEALHTPAFWLLSAAHACALLVVGAVLVHQVPHMVEGMGLTPEAAAANVALLVLVSMTGQMVGGYVGDRLDKRLLMFGCMWLHAAALMIFAFATTRAEAVVFAVLHGAAWGVRGILINAVRADYFGRSAYASITGFNSLFVMVGMTGGPLFSGLLFDLTGDYRTAFLVLATLAALGSIAMYLARRPLAQPVHVPA